MSKKNTMTAMYFLGFESWIGLRNIIRIKMYILLIQFKTICENI